MAFSRSETFDFDARYGADTLPRSVYVATLALYIAGGLASAALVASHTYGMPLTWWWIISFFILAIPGVMLSAGSENPLISTLGYSLVIAASGAIMGPAVAAYDLDIVIKAAGLTFGATLAAGLAGALYPKSLESWGGYLFAGLGLLIVGDILHIVLLSLGVVTTPITVLDYFGAALFTAYIVYDMNRAMRLPATLDNAVDCAVALYLDIINLFLRLLSILGRSDD